MAALGKVLQKMILDSFGNNLARGGDWIELKAGIPKEMDVLIGEVPGGGFLLNVNC